MIEGMRKVQSGRRVLAATGAMLALAVGAGQALGAANPGLPFYGYGSIVPVPNPAIVNQNTVITVTVGNDGDTPATNVDVQLSFNDWGVTFQGWQPIDSVQTIPSIGAGGSENVVFNNVFTTAAHTCLEALIIDADENTNPNDDRGQINMEVVNAGSAFTYEVPVRNRGDAVINVGIAGNCDTGGRPEIECNVEERPMVPLVPGGEVRLPIAVDFPPGTVRGTEVILDVEAEDLANPGDRDHTNHVRIVVTFETARGLKQDAVATLDLLTFVDPKQDATVAKVMAKLQKTLDSPAWIDDSTVMLKGGGAVLGGEYGALKQLVKLAPSLTGTDRATVEAVIADIVDAERILASSAIEAATGDTSLAWIERHVGDVGREAGNALEAVKRYRKAWKLAIKAA